MTGGTRRIALRIAMAFILAAGLGSALGLSELTTPLVLLAVASVAWLGWVVWDEGRGRSHKIRTSLDAFAAEIGGQTNTETLHLQLFENQPLTLRFAVRRDGNATMAALTPTPSSTVSFRIWPDGTTRPGFDGQEPNVGGPRLETLPGLETILTDLFKSDEHPAPPRFHMEGNAPDRLMAVLSPDFRAALANALAIHGQGFRGVSFDGNLLAVHWVGAALTDPATTLATTRMLLMSLLPGQPAPPREILH